RERVVGEVDLLLLFVPLVHGEIDDPAEREPIAVDQPEVGTHFGARKAGEPDEVSGSTSDEEHRIASGEAQLIGNLFSSLWSDILCNWAGCFKALPRIDDATLLS